MRVTSSVQKQRPGVCHRCGWRGSVGKVHRRDRRFAMSANDYARLCDDCITVVFHGGSSARVVHGSGHGHVKLTVVGDRDVA
jgi:hypothetical protein